MNLKVLVIEDMNVKKKKKENMNVKVHVKIVQLTLKINMIIDHSLFFAQSTLFYIYEASATY